MGLTEADRRRWLWELGLSRLVGPIGPKAARKRDCGQCQRCLAFRAASITRRAAVSQTQAAKQRVSQQKVKYLGQTLDVRTDTHVIYAQMTINDYLAVIGENFDEFKIQRRREKHRAYARMREDIIKGAQLPSITLALKPELVPEALELLKGSGDDKSKLEGFLP